MKSNFSCFSSNSPAKVRALEHTWNPQSGCRQRNEAPKPELGFALGLGVEEDVVEQKDLHLFPFGIDEDSLPNQLPLWVHQCLALSA